MGKISVNGNEVARGRIDQTQCCVFSADEGADVGLKEGTPVSEAYKVPFKFTGKIEKVTVDIAPINSADDSAVIKANDEATFEKAMSD
jgi:hypothetical protein